MRDSEKLSLRSGAQDKRKALPGDEQVRVALSRVFEPPSRLRTRDFLLPRSAEAAPADVVSERRRCAEVPYQMLQAGELRELQRFLTDIRHVRTMLSTIYRARTPCGSDHALTNSRRL